VDAALAGHLTLRKGFVMSITEPDYEKHHVFDSMALAQEFYDTLPEEEREMLAPPRQSHGWTWIIDKVEK
jgi:hypothetical protein